MLFALNEMKQTWLQEVLDEDAVAQTSGESGVAGGPCGSRECGVLGAGRGQGPCGSRECGVLGAGRAQGPCGSRECGVLGAGRGQGPCGSRECGVLGAGRGQGALSLCSSQARASHQALTDGTGRP